jgi:spoIIIJ-associated protein
MNTYTGKTVEEAVAAAAADKGVSAEEIHYSITEEKDGLLGIGKSVTIEAFTMDDIKEFLFDYLGDYFTGIDLDIEVAIEEREDGFTVNLNADNNAVLIGRMGKTLSAFNTVVRAAVNAAFKKRVDILIDVNHYKEERYAKLRSMAKRIGRQVQRSHVDAELDPMPNDERKVIHKTLNEWHNLKTESEGAGSARHVCIRYVEDEPAVNETETTETPVENTEA